MDQFAHRKDQDRLLGTCLWFILVGVGLSISVYLDSALARTASEGASAWAHLGSGQGGCYLVLKPARMDC